MIPFLSKYTAKLSFFAKVGALSGAMVGSLFTLLHATIQNLTWPETFIAGVTFSVFAWLGMLLLFGIWLRYTIKQIWLQTFIVTLFTGLTIVVILNLWVTSFGGLIGFILGIIIGSILHWLCHLLFKRPKLQVINRTE